MQAVDVSVMTQMYAITVSSIYSPPGYSLNPPNTKTWLKNGKRIYGNFNVKTPTWRLDLLYLKGKNCYEQSEIYNVTLLSTGRPTYWPTYLHQVLDLIDFLSIRTYLTFYV